VKRTLVIAATAATALVLPAAAFAHAALLSTTPAASVTVNTPPRQVALVYSEAVEPRFAIVSVTDSAAHAQTAGPPHRSPANADELDVPLKHLRQGWYLVVWRVISVDGHVYFKAPFSKYQEISASEAAALPDLAALFDPTKGLPGVMAAGRSPQASGTEKVGGVDCDRITTSYSADQVAQVLGGGLTPSGDIAATLLVGASDHLLRRVKLSGPLVASSSSASADVTLHDFNAPVTITAPAI